MIRDLFYLAVYLITEMILYSIAYCTVFNKKITRNFKKILLSSQENWPSGANDV